LVYVGHSSWVDFSKSNIAYSSTHQGYDDEDIEVRRQRHPSNDIRDLKKEALQLDKSLNSKNYLD